MLCPRLDLNMRLYHATSYTPGRFVTLIMWYFCNMRLTNVAMSNIALESLGDSITTATIAAWHKAPGDAVAVDDIIVSVDTDKVSVDIKAKSAGVFGSALVEEGGEVFLICVIFDSYA